MKILKYAQHTPHVPALLGWNTAVLFLFHFVKVAPQSFIQTTNPASQKN